jgi:hypothetical protein
MAEAGEHKVVALDGDGVPGHYLRSLPLPKVGCIRSQQLLEVGDKMTLPGNSEDNPSGRDKFIDNAAV